MAEKAFRWSEVDRDTYKPLCDLLETIRRDLARNPMSRIRVVQPADIYPKEIWERQQFEVRARDRADDWMQSAFDIYVDAVRRLDFEPT